MEQTEHDKGHESQPAEAQAGGASGMLPDLLASLAAIGPSTQAELSGLGHMEVTA